ncbi:MAG: L-2-amino-thiazoline-4-carboxylic acid hydrolase [Candidatus Hodarchaeales archaeon]
MTDKDAFEENSEYLANRKKKMMRYYRFLKRLQKGVLKRHFEEDKIDAWLTRVEEDLEMMIPSIPYIGGNDNIFSKFLGIPSMLIPLVKIMKEDDVPTRKIGQIIFELAERSYFLIPQPVRWWNSRKFFSTKQKETMKDAAAKTQERKYPGDWVCNFIEGDGKSFDYGIDMVECGLLKFWGELGLEEYVPYLCLTDWALWNSRGIEVRRTTTLANGGEKCDYRFIKRGKNCPRGWPPESLEEWTGKYEKQ